MPVRILVFVLTLVLCLAVQAPAWLIDSLLAQTTAQSLRLTQIEGTLWGGRGQLIVVDPVSRSAQPWIALEWHWLPARVFKGELAWRLAGDAKPAGDVAAGIRGWRAEGLALLAPARFAMERIPSTFGRLGWRGDLQLETSQWQCTWKMSCNGRGSLRWAGAAVDILRGRPLGDYQIDFVGTGEKISLSWGTQNGATKITAQGDWSPKGPWSLQGEIQGDPAFLQRLPSVAGEWVRPASGPGHYRFDLRG